MHHFEAFLISTRSLKHILKPHRHEVRIHSFDAPFSKHSLNFQGSDQHSRPRQTLTNCTSVRIAASLSGKSIQPPIRRAMALRTGAKLFSRAARTRSVSTFTLPDLKYGYAALEPHIDEKTMTVHHTRHHQAYVSNLNGALTGDFGSTIQGMPLEEIQRAASSLPEEIRTTVINHGGGHYNHCLFFSILAPETERAAAPVDELSSKIEADFGNLDAMRKEFDAAAMKVFGSGWAWLALGDDGKLTVSHTKNQENPLMNGVVSQSATPIMGLDIWEHAMYLKYLNRRAEYVSAFWNIIDWEQVAANYASAREGNTAVFDVPMGD